MRQKRKIRILSEDAKNMLKLLKGADVDCTFTKFFAEREFDSIVRIKMNYIPDRLFKSRRKVVAIIYDRHAQHYFTVAYGSESDDGNTYYGIEEYVLSNQEMENLMVYVNKIITAKQYAEIKKGF